MKGIKKFISLTVAIAMVASIGLSGCGSKDQAGESATASQSSAAGSSVAADSSKALEFASLRCIIPGNKPKDFDLVKDEWNKYLKEKINAEFNLEFLGWDVWGTKRSAMLASNENLDMTFTASFDGYYNDVAKGAFAELDSLIDQYGQDMKKAIEPAYLEGPRVKGKLYVIPCNKETAEAHAQWFRTDLLKKYNLTVTPDMTIEDFDPIFKTIQEKEPGISPMYGVSFYGVTKGEVANFEKFDNVPGFEFLYVEHATGKVYNKFELDWATDRYRVIRDYKLKKYGDRTPQDAITDQGEAIKAGKIFSWSGMDKPGEAESIQGGSNLSELPTKANALKPKTSNGTTAGPGLAIVSYSKNQERSMMAINLLWSDEKLINLVTSGIEGKHYIKSTDSKYLKRLPEGISSQGDTYESSGFNWELGNQLETLIWNNQPADKWEQYRQFNKSAYISPLLGFVFDPEPVKTEVSAMNNAYETFKGILNDGSADANETLAKLNEKLKASGIDKVIAECQKQYDEWKALSK